MASELVNGYRHFEPSRAALVKWAPAIRQAPFDPLGHVFGQSVEIERQREAGLHQSSPSAAALRSSRAQLFGSGFSAVAADQNASKS